MREVPKRATDTGPDSAEARVEKYAQDQQGLSDWADSAVQRYADVIRLALEGPLPVEAALRKELEAAGRRFNYTTSQIWRVAQTRYRKSDAHIRALAEEFVSAWARELQDAIERERLGEIDDEEDLPPESTGETEPESVKIRAKTKVFIEAIHKETKRDERDIRAQLRAVMREHTDIGEVPAGPPGAREWMQEYREFQVTPRGVFAPSAGLFNWERVSKTPLAPFAHSSVYGTDVDPRVHILVLTSEGQILREIEIPLEKVQSPRTAVTALTRANVYIPRTPFAHAHIVELLNFKPKGRKIVRTRQTGWLRLVNDNHFLSPIGTIAPKSNAPVTRRSNAKPQPEIIVRLDRPIGSAGRNYGFHVSGSVEDWQNQIVKPLDGCSNVALAAAVNFAAPLVAFADEQTGGPNIYGPSSIGKSAAGAVGESIYGIPSTATAVSNDVEPFGAKWASASDAGIVALAQKRTDVGLFLDELGSAKSIREKFIEMIYILTGGTPKLRADSKGDLRQQSGFRTMLFSTSEIPLRDLLEKLDDTEGRKKRVFDVPALVGKMTALETVPHHALKEVCGGIYAHTARLHGAVGQAWLRHVAELGEVGRRTRLDQHRQAWLALPEIVDLLHRNPQDDSVIHRHALLAAALRIAAEPGLWPWSVESSDRAIVACCLRWAADKDAAITTLEQRVAEQKLREALRAKCNANQLVVLNLECGGRGGPTFKPAPEHAALYQDVDLKNPGTIFGFIKYDGANTRILLFHDAFRRLSGECGDHDALVGYLKRKKLLEIKSEKVRGSSDQYYVLVGTFLLDETPSA
jgi:hypothetical protein